MRNITFLFLTFFAVLTAKQTALSQTNPVSDTLRANSIHARIQSNGALFVGGTNGYFLAPPVLGAAPSVSLIKSAGLWMGGKDPAGNLRLSAQMYNENGKSDYAPGTLSSTGAPYPEFNLVAGINSDEINAHIANPGSMLPAVYGWPGRGNQFFSNYHNFNLPIDPWWLDLAGYFDDNSNGNYDPFIGEYPSISARGCPQQNYADDMLWTVFNDAVPHTQSGGLPLNMEVQTQVLGLHCPEGSPADRTIYVIYKMTNRDTVPLDSCYFGVFLDVEIGNGGDDFIGSMPNKRVVFAYNGDATDEGGFESTPPVLGIDLLRGPFDPVSETEVEQWQFVTVNEAGLTSPEAYYHLLAGRDTDGTPFPNNGILYDGDPLNPAGWSEVTAGNTPGERKVLASFGPFNLLPGAINELIFGFAWVRKYPNGNVADNLSILGATMSEVQGIYDNCFELFPGCPAAVSVVDPENPSPLVVSPNPFADLIQVESKGATLQTLTLWDVTGRMLQERSLEGQHQAMLPTGNLPTGIYLLQVRCADGSVFTHKLTHE